jgi:hypothetical protein
MMKTTLSALRVRAGRSIVWCAAESGTSPPTVKLYETSPEAVTPEKKRAIERIYARIAAEDLGLPPASFGLKPP